MYEKCNPCHPDKIADRIAGAIVDLAYKINDTPHISVEVLTGHNKAYIIAETDVDLSREEIKDIVYRIANVEDCEIMLCRQDRLLNANQANGVRCADNGIFKGMPTNYEEIKLTEIAHKIYSKYYSDGKYILDNDKLIICQSHAHEESLRKLYPYAIINPLGYWTGGINVDCGATNRKLGSDMGRAVTGGGLHGKDLSKADVSVNIYAYLKAQATGEPVEISCAIGDEIVDGIPYEKIVEQARRYISNIGGFEKFAEWGLIR